MKIMFSKLPAALSVAFFAFAFTPAQAGPMGFEKSLAENTSATGLAVTKVKNRGHRSHRKHGRRHRGHFRRRNFGIGIGIGSLYPLHYGLGGYYSPRYSRGYDYRPGYVYDPDYAYEPDYYDEPRRSYRYRDGSRAADRIFKQQEQDGP